MMDLEHERRLADVEGRAKSNTRRIEDLEKSNEALNTLATNMAVMAEKQNEVAVTVNKLDGKVTELESKPAKRWETLVGQIITLLAAAIAGFLLAKLGL